MGIIFAVTYQKDVAHFLMNPPASTIPVGSSLDHIRAKVRGFVCCMTQTGTRQLFGCFSIKKEKCNSLFQRRRGVQLHVHPGRQRHLSDVGAEHRGRRRRARRRLRSRRLLGETLLRFSLFAFNGSVESASSPPPPPRPCSEEPPHHLHSLHHKTITPSDGPNGPWSSTFQRC